METKIKTIPDKSHARTVRASIDALCEELPLSDLLTAPERARQTGVALSVTTDMVVSAAQIAEGGDGRLGGIPLDPEELRAVLAWDQECAGLLSLLGQFEQRLRDDLTVRWAAVADKVLAGYAKLRQQENASSGTTNMDVQELRTQRPKARRRRGSPETATAPPAGGPKTLLVPVTVPTS